MFALLYFLFLLFWYFCYKFFTLYCKMEYLRDKTACFCNTHVWIQGLIGDLGTLYLLHPSIHVETHLKTLTLFKITVGYHYLTLARYARIPWIIFNLQTVAYIGLLCSNSGEYPFFLNTMSLSFFPSLFLGGGVVGWGGTALRSAYTFARHIE